MNKFLALLALILSIFSCQKSNDNPNTTTSAEPSTSFSFSIQGKADSIIGSGSTSSTEGSIIKRVYSSLGGHYYYYELEAYKYSLNANQTYIALDFNMSSLKVGSYQNKTFPSNADYASYYSNGGVQTSVLYYSGLDGYYGSAEAGTTNISITKIENGYVSGTFSASKLKNASGCTTCAATIQVTNGVFKNVKVLE